jgi:NAD(P)-dependent dehydrogenase (short-subunit alcohol dehydrogenase family)
MIEMQGRVALVTGAARGVGTRIAEGLVEALVFVMDQVYKSIFGSNKTDRLTLLSSPTPEIRWIAERAERFEARYDALLGAALWLPAWCTDGEGPSFDTRPRRSFLFTRTGYGAAVIADVSDAIETGEYDLSELPIIQKAQHNRKDRIWIS